MPSVAATHQTAVTRQRNDDVHATPAVTATPLPASLIAAQ